MIKLEAGKNYVTKGGEETGPLRAYGEAFVSDNIRAKDIEGHPTSKQYWFEDGTVMSPTSFEDDDVIVLDYPKRWIATITYRIGGGFVNTSIAEFEEFTELGDIIEAGPNFHTVEDVVVKLNPAHLALMYKKG